MGFFDWLKGQFIDVIEWLDDSHDTLVYRFERYGNEIKYGAKLIVREGQVAIFVSEGKLADIFGPGTYVLETKNLPILTSLQHWDHGFQSPFKAEVYFVSTARFTNLRWGTKGEVIIPDPQFGTVPIRAYGSYEIRVKDPAKFLREVVGTDGLFTTDEIKDQLSNLIVSNFPKAIGELGISVRELAFHYRELGEKVREYLQPLFESYGLSLEKLVIENVSLPDRIVQAIEERVSQNILGDMDQYLKYKAAEGMGKGEGSQFLEMGVGMGMATQMASLFGGKGGGGATPASPPPPPPPPSQTRYYLAQNGETKGPFTEEQLREMLQRGEIDGESYIWHEGLEGWKRLKEVLPNLLPPPPPPPPPPPKGE